ATTSLPLVGESVEPQLRARVLVGVGPAVDLEVEVAVRTRARAERHVDVDAGELLRRAHAIAPARASPDGNSAHSSIWLGSAGFVRAATPRHHQVGSSLTLMPCSSSRLVCSSSVSIIET